MRRSIATCVAVLGTSGVMLGASAAAATATGTTAAANPATAVTTTAATAPTATAAAPAAAKAPAATAPAATPAVKAAAKLGLSGAFTIGHDAVTVTGRRVVVQGSVRPYVPGQTVEVRAFVGRRRFKTDKLRVKPGAKGAGTFSEKLSSPGAGIVRVTVTHARTPQMLGFIARKAYAALSPHAGFGARGQFVSLIQQRLAALHVFVPQTGTYDQQTGLAVDAYHRLLHRGTSQLLDAGTLAALLDGQAAFPVRYPHDGTHAEGNLGLQLLALIHGSSVDRIYPISSGKPSTPTVLGRFRIYQRTPGYLPDGMYYSSFFYRGYAIHGYDPAPDYPASHGCMRLPIVDAIGVFDWLDYGDWVDVYQ